MIGGSASKVDDVTASHIQDGGYALLWQRYDNNKMAAICYYGNVMAKKYISSVYDCTFYIYFFVISQLFDAVDYSNYAFLGVSETIIPSKHSTVIISRRKHIYITTF